MDFIKIGKRLCGAVESRTGGREENQDSYVMAESRMGLFVGVCDGMGGGPSGKHASETACAVMGTIVNNAKPDTAVKPLLKYAVETANKKLYEEAGEHPEMHGMGTTCVCTLISGNKAHVIHVGDSRCLLIRNGKVQWRTQDHSYLAELIRKGSITEEQAARSSYSNVITRAIGIKPDVEPDYTELQLKPGDRLALMSDGIWGMAPENLLIKCLTSDDSPAQIIGNIEDNIDTLGHDNGGGHDNMTLMLIEIPDEQKKSESEPADKPVGKRSRKRLIVTIVILALLCLTGINAFFFFRGKDADKADGKGVEAKEEQTTVKGEREIRDLEMTIEDNKGADNKEEANNSDAIINDAIDKLQTLREYSKKGYKPQDRPSVIEARRRMRIEIVQKLTEALKEEESPEKSEELKNLIEEINESSVICTGIDLHQGKTTRDGCDKIDKIISSLKKIK